MFNFVKSLFAPGPPVPDEFRSPSPDDPDYHSKLAELALKEMKAYRGKVVAQARLDPSLVQSLESDVRRAYEAVAVRTGDVEVARAAFREALRRTFGEDAGILEPLFQKDILERSMEKQR